MISPPPDPTDDRPAESREQAAFVVGAATAAVCLGLVIFVLGPSVRGSWQRPEVPPPVLDVPADVLAELTELGAVIGNAGNPTGVEPHETPLARPDDHRGWVLKPDVHVEARLLGSPRPFNWDAPVLYFPAGAQLPPRSAAWVDADARLRWSVQTDSAGHRRTLPEVESDREVVVIGDSVAFGVGVDDVDTIASALQLRVGDGLQVVNGGVGGYQGDQLLAAIGDLVGPGTERVVYLACENDFAAAEDPTGEVARILGGLREAVPVGVPIDVLLHTYLPYNAPALFAGSGWPTIDRAVTDSIRREVLSHGSALGMEIVDWSLEVDAHVRSARTPFAALALYADHCHLSPLGNERAAAAIADRWPTAVPPPPEPPRPDE